MKIMKIIAWNQVGIFLQKIFCVMKMCNGELYHIMAETVRDI